MTVRLVIADDAEQLRTLLASALTASGDIEVVGEASDGAQAVAAVRSLKPDVLLLDLSMPVLDGLEVLRKIAESDDPPAVVVFSGYGTSELETTCTGLGAAAYVKKGTPVPELRSVIVNAGAASR